MPETTRLSLSQTDPTDRETLSCAQLLEPAALRRFFVGSISDMSPTPEREDERIAAQRFFKKYVAGVLPASLLALAGGVAVDVSIPRLRFAAVGDELSGVILDIAGGAHRSAERAVLWPIAVPSVATLEELRALAFRALFAGNLEPAAEALMAVVHVSRRLLLSTIAEQLEFFYTGFRAAEICDVDVLESDRDMLFHAKTLPGPRPNPLSGSAEWEYQPDLGRSFLVREVCCMQFKVPTRKNRYCATCGIPTVEQRNVMRRRGA